MSGSRVVHLWTQGNHCYSLMCSLENGKSCLFLNQHVSSHPDYVDLAGGLVDELFCLLKELFVSSRFSLKSLFIKVWDQANFESLYHFLVKILQKVSQNLHCRKRSILTNTLSWKYFMCSEHKRAIFVLSLAPISLSQGQFDR